MKTILTKHSDDKAAHIIFIPETLSEQKALNEGNERVITVYSARAVQQKFPDRKVMIAEPLEDEQHHYLCYLYAS